MICDLRALSLPSGWRWRGGPATIRQPASLTQHPNDRRPANMKCLLVSSAIVALFSAFCITYLNAARIPGFRSLVRPIEENSLSPVASYEVPRSNQQIREWVKVKHSGPRMSRVTAGSQIELECEASGSPPPSVQWLHGVQPVSQTILESNTIGGVRLGTVKSILIIDCVTPRHQGSYTCVAQSGSETTTSLPAKLYVQENVTSLMSPQCSQGMSSSPRIITWSPINMDTIGSDVLLPCVAVGNPAPQVYWLDKENNLISIKTKPDPRYKLLDSGDLFISKVNWSDMGGFTCIAESPLGRDTVTTFLYPMLGE